MRVTVSPVLVLLAWAFPRPLSGQALSCPPVDSLGGRGSVIGQVVETRTQVPLGFAQLFLRIHGVETPIEARSDPSGRFRFCSVPAGIFTVSGQLGQLGGLAGPSALGPGETHSVLLELAPAPRGRDTGSLLGMVVDVESEDPVDGATVLVLPFGQTAISNSNGRFTFPSLPQGEVEIQVDRLGYARTLGHTRIGKGEMTEIRIEVSTEPISMDPITVTGTRRRIELPGLEDFERRLNSGWGQFILEDEIQRRAPPKLTRIISDYGITVTGDGKAIRMRRTGCGPLVYIDDVKMTHLPRGRGFGGADIGAQYPFPVADLSPETEAADAVNLIHPSDITAVEIYRGPAEVPGQYLDSNAKCGVILIWTRRGNLSGR